MLSKVEIDKYLDSIPPIPQTIKKTLLYLNNSDMVQAANVAKEDKAFTAYLSQIVNKPIFGFRDEITNINQIFGILGLNRAKQMIFSYYMQIILPKNWEVFDFSNKKFQDLQANLMIQWDKILESLEIKNENLQESITLIPAALIVCEMLFRDIKDTVKLLREEKAISYDVILFKMSGYKLLDIVEQIALKWKFDNNTIVFLRKLSFDGVDKSVQKETVLLRLLMSHEMSKPYMMESGLNDFFDFPTEYLEKDILFFNDIIRLER